MSYSGRSLSYEQQGHPHGRLGCCTQQSDLAARGGAERVAVEECGGGALPEFLGVVDGVPVFGVGGGGDAVRADLQRERVVGSPDRHNVSDEKVNRL